MDTCSLCCTLTEVLQSLEENYDHYSTDAQLLKYWCTVTHSLGAELWFTPKNLSQKKWQEHSAVLFLAADWFVVLRMSFRIYAVNLPHNAEENVFCGGVEEGEWLREKN